MNYKYRIKIVWSDEDKCYLVKLPEFPNALQCYFTHGNTYAEEVLELLIEDYEETGKPLPSPQVLQLA